MAGLFDYQVAEKIAASGAPVDALIMAAALRADGNVLGRLRTGFPDLIDEAHARYNAPGGRLENE